MSWTKTGTLQTTLFLPDLAHCFLSLLFALYPVAAVNLSPGHDYMLSPVYPPRGRPDPNVVSEPRTQPGTVLSFF